MMPKVEISIVDIITYIGDRSRPLKEGEAIFKARHVIMCGLKNGECNQIISLCLQTSALQSVPHEVHIDLGNEETNWICQCSCKAAKSEFCKHVVATLLYINRHEELEVLSATDLIQNWGKEKKAVSEMYSELTTDEFCHLPKHGKITTPSTTKEVDALKFDILVSCKSSLALSKFKNRTQNANDKITRDLRKNSARCQPLRDFLERSASMICR